MKLDVDITDKQAMALAQFLKRVGFTDIRPRCYDEEESYDAQYALEKIREALAEQGYNPR